MIICYQGPLKDYSGYGEANRHAVAALHTAGVTVVPKLVSYSVESSDFGSIGKMLEPLYANDGDYKIKVLHTTPNVYKKHMERGKYHIGHFFWETDKVPEDFARGLRLMDEIWTGSEANKQAIENAGIEVPIYIFPQAIETDRQWPKPYEIPEFDGFLFYSIFEWTERKNPGALLQAYWQEFQKGENVGLVIKTYFSHFGLANKRVIRHQIRNLKRRSELDKFPETMLYLDLMDRNQVMRLHSTGDCYVSAHHGEGWGVPQVEAALAGKPVISTGYGGCHEYFNDGKDMKILPYNMIPVTGMEHSSQWYTRDQKWANVEVKELRAAMRWAYENQKAAKAMGVAARKHVKSTFNLEVVGKLMADRLAEIEKSLS